MWKLVTPAAVIAVAAGIGLIFAEEIRDTWMMAKLAAVAGLVICHAYIGHIVTLTGDKTGSYRVPTPVPVLLAGAGRDGPRCCGWSWPSPILSRWPTTLPDWLNQPFERELPSWLIPI